MRHPTTPPKNSRGFTLIEMMTSVAILAIIVLVIGKMTLTTTRALTQTEEQFKASIALRSASDKIETSLLNANKFLLARSTEIIFIADRNTDPTYLPYSDEDSDGIVNLNDPDDDDDATTIVVSSMQWSVGYDMKDDDEDGDNQIDMRWRIRLSTSQQKLYLDFSRNQEAWGNHEELIADHITSTQAFTFFGSKDTQLCPTCTTTDTDSNGIITSGEIDAVANGGNGNLFIDTSTEFDKIVTVSVSLTKNDNPGSGNPSSEVTVEVLPPPVYLKRRP